MSAVAYLASYLSRMKELPIALVASIIKRFEDIIVLIIYARFCDYNNKYVEVDKNVIMS